MLHDSVVWWRDTFLLPVVMVVAVLKGSENRRPAFNLLLLVLSMTICYPKLVVAVLRPKHIVRRLLSGLPNNYADKDYFVSVGGDTTYKTMDDKEQQQQQQQQQEHDEDPSLEFGGGAINEKKRQYVPPSMTVSDSDKATNGTTAAPSSTEGTGPTRDSLYSPSTKKAHLYHALEGLDRYPNYLARWNSNDIDSLETSLKETLAQVQKQRNVLENQQRAVNELVNELLSEHEHKNRWNKLLQPCQTWEEVRERILDPKAADAIFNSKMFNPKYNKNKRTFPKVEDVIKGQVQVELDPERLETLLDEEFFDVFSFRLLNKAFCEDLSEFVKEISILSGKAQEVEKQQFGKRPLNLDVLGLSWINDLLFHLVMRPVARQLFLESEGLGGELDFRNGYVAGYSATPGSGKPRERLVTHTDDSEVTMNICLGDVFEGGLLEFRGLRGTAEEGQLVGTFRPQTGLALIHAGRHFHDVTQVVSGDRFAYIMWGRSWGGIRAQQCPCCWLNRRQGTDCVCGSRWN